VCWDMGHLTRFALLTDLSPRGGEVFSPVPRAGGSSGWNLLVNVERRYLPDSGMLVPGIGEVGELREPGGVLVWKIAGNLKPPPSRESGPRCGARPTAEPGEDLSEDL